MTSKLAHMQAGSKSCGNNSASGWRGEYSHLIRWAPSHRQVILIGHNVKDDIETLDIFGVQVEEYSNLVGVVNTQVLVEDAWDGTLPESLSGLVLKLQPVRQSLLEEARSKRRVPRKGVYRTRFALWNQQLRRRRRRRLHGGCRDTSDSRYR